MYTDIAQDALAVLLVGGLAYASWEDWKAREVSDAVWAALAVPGALLGVVAWGTGSAVALGAWALAAAFVLEHLFPWDIALERLHPDLPAYLEWVAYAAVIAGTIAIGWRFGLGARGLPIAVIAVIVSVLLARLLFEVGVLYGGADAKALMVAGLLVPLFAQPVLAVPATARSVLAYYPFSLNLLMDGAILAIAIPIGLALWNLRRGDFVFPRAFTSYRIPVEELSSSFVWLRDPLLERDATEAETSEEDLEERKRQQAELLALGVREVWVTPQLPFIILLFAGAVVALLAGNLIFDVGAWL
jgi:prepilin signal peptidase PulO-like enzyme (type II secretory pathway)